MGSEPVRNRLGSAPVRPIVAPLWLGAERRGPERGAPALLEALHTRWTPARVGPDARRLRDAIVLEIATPEHADDLLNQRNPVFADVIGTTAQRHASVVETAITQGELALTLGGDHAVAFGSIAGAATSHTHTGLIWIDTHPDLNTPQTSPSGHLHGMPLGTAIGLDGRALPQLETFAGTSPLIDPRDVVMLGVRDIDPAESDAIRQHGIWALTMEAWTDAGILAGLDRALHHLEGRGVEAVHVSIDLDVLDPSVMPGTGTRWPGGLTVREASQVMRQLHRWSGPIHSFDLVELNPALDTSGFSVLTAALLLAGALGARMMPSGGPD